MKRKAVLISVVVLACAPDVQADGGVLRLSLNNGPLQVTVFTTPTPPVAGPVEVSVLVQNAARGGTVRSAHVQVRARIRGQTEWKLFVTATPETSTNKLMSAAELHLATPGRWEIEVSVEEKDRASGSFELDVGEPIPGWLSLAPWMAWAAIVVGMYMMHWWLVGRKEREN